ncbi:MAG: hypothetical protein ABI901_14920 [Roseiflexaceae bacterium]
MDSIQLSTLIAEIEAQMARVTAVNQVVESRVALLEKEQIAAVEALAYQLHNFYNACEDLLKLVATAFENHITDQGNWHRGLVQRMSLTISGVRPALISAATLPHLDQLRAFRHFFRHAYNTPINIPRLMLVLDDARLVHPLMQADVNHFVSHLRTVL